MFNTHIVSPNEDFLYIKEGETFFILENEQKLAFTIPFWILTSWMSGNLFPYRKNRINIDNIDPKKLVDFLEADLSPPSYGKTTVKRSKDRITIRWKKKKDYLKISISFTKYRYAAIGNIEWKLSEKHYKKFRMRFLLDSMKETMPYSI